MVGDSDVVVAGGHESMSQAPHCVHMRDGTRMGGAPSSSTRCCATASSTPSTDTTWGSTAENVAERWQITREQQDAFAAASQQKAEAGPEGGQVRRRDCRRSPSGPGRVRSIVDTDEHPEARHDRREAREAPARIREGRHRDGRKRLGDQRRRRGARSHDPRERREARGSSRWPESSPGPPPGVDPSPSWGRDRFPASRRALEKAGWSTGDLDLVEANEAFAAQACAVNKDLGWDTGKVNVNGGAIALGHPVGAPPERGC